MVPQLMSPNRMIHRLNSPLRKIGNPLRTDHLVWKMVMRATTYNENYPTEDSHDNGKSTMSEDVIISY